MGRLPGGVGSPVAPVMVADVVGVTLTSRELQVYGRIRRCCASRPNGTVAAGLIGSAGACRSLISKGLIVEEVESVGRQGGVYHRYRVCGPAGPVGPKMEPAGVLPPVTGFPHGVAGSYTNHGCRCSLCTDAHALAVAGYRAGHGQQPARLTGPVILPRPGPPRQAEVTVGRHVVASVVTEEGCGSRPDPGGVVGDGALVLCPTPAEGAPGPGLRRPPTQARARERLERLLDAAERVFEDVGFEAATTTLIAAEGERPIGSIYHFFTDKEGIAEALAARYLPALRTALDDRSGLGLGGIVDTVAEFAQRHPGLGPLLQRPSRAEATDLSREVSTVLTDHLERLLTVPHSPPGHARRRTVAVMCASLLRCLFEMVAAQPPDRRAVVVAETRLAFVAYTTNALPSGGALRAEVTTPAGWPTTGPPGGASTQPRGPRRNPTRQAAEQQRPGPRRNPARQNPKRPPLAQ